MTWSLRSSVFLRALDFLYYGFLNAAPRGQTVGKMAFRIQTIDAENGQLIDVGRSMTRYLIVFLLSLPCGIPYIIDANGIGTILQGV